MGLTLRNPGFLGSLGRFVKIDPTFSIGTGFSGGVRSITIQPDDKILVSGFFAFYNGTQVDYIVRLNSDGTLDPGFSNADPGFNVFVLCSAVQSDGKIIVGGSFSSYNDTTQNRIARLNSDGTLDTSFNNGGSGFNVGVTSIRIQTDGKIVVGGDFTSYNGTTQNRITRLNSDGSRDTGFDPGSGFNGGIRDVAIQSDGKIIVCGSFTSYNGTTQNNITRLNSDGSIDNTFTIGTGFDGTTINLEIQSNGKIIVCGGFTSYNGTTQNNITRLNSDGSRDNAFTIGSGFNNTTYSTSIQTDGKILVGGFFTSYNGTTQNRITRLNSDGTIDMGFTIGLGFNDIIDSIRIQTDGKIVLGGDFTSYNGTTQNRITRLLPPTT